METITFSKNIKMKVTHADNLLQVYVNGDRANKGGAQIYCTDNAFSPELNDTIDITPYVNVVDGEAVLTAIASNFYSGGDFRVELVVDGASRSFINEKILAYHSNVHAVKLKKS